MITLPPSAQKITPTFREASAQRSLRDSDSVPRMWSKLSAIAFNVSESLKAIESQGQQITRLKRRIVGGGAAPVEPWPPTLYDASKSYLVGDWVWVQASSNAVTVGYEDADTGEVVTAAPGLWRCLKDASPTTTPPEGYPAGTYYHSPQLPMPTDDNPTASNNYWLFVSPNTYCL